MNFSRAAASYAFSRFAETWTKLRMFEQTEYRTLVCLDADMMVLQNIDELLSLRFDASRSDGCDLFAVPACICNEHHTPLCPPWWVPANCAYSPENFSRLALDNISSPALATSRIAPLEPDSPRPYFNAGLFVIQPSRSTADKLFEFLVLAPDEQVSRWAFLEQDMLHDFFHGRWKPLPYVYNCLKKMPITHPDIFDLEAVKVIHFIKTKPWEEAEDVPTTPDTQLHSLWWREWAKLVQTVDGN
uniref:Glycosyl transferase family 8 n=1 Tax=Candidatus Kentrum sp. TUN TaxID=2126343 RepID=A0A451A3J2_9GAMM|nr:MAG: Glycosyl transferase family 8 [Candidatus Kentron sp. TUN]